MDDAGGNNLLIYWMLCDCQQREGVRSLGSVYVYDIIKDFPSPSFDDFYTRAACGARTKKNVRYRSGAAFLFQFGVKINDMGLCKAFDENNLTSIPHAVLSVRRSERSFKNIHCAAQVFMSESLSIKIYIGVKHELRLFL